MNEVLFTTQASYAMPATSSKGTGWAWLQRQHGAYSAWYALQVQFGTDSWGEQAEIYTNYQIVGVQR